MKPVIKTASGSSNISETISFGMSSDYQWELDEINLHLSTLATAANDLVIQKRSKYGSAYDVKILVQPMVGVGDVVFQPDRPMKMNGKDRVTVAWTNDAASFKSWGLQVNCKA